MSDKDVEILKQTVARLERKVNELSSGSQTVTDLGARSSIDFQPPLKDPATPPAANFLRNGDDSHSVGSWFRSVVAVNDEFLECAFWFSHAGPPAAGQTLTTTNAISSSTNNTLKASTHSTYSAARCDWGLPAGVARLTGGASLDAPFPNNSVYPGRPMYLGSIVALLDETIVVPDDLRVAVMLYNNTPLELDFMKSGVVFQLSGQVRGTPAGTTERRYKVLAETDRGYSYLSDELTLAAAPDDNSFTSNVDVYLSWPRIDGVLRYKVYRRNVVAGTYDLLKIITSGSNTYGDNNAIVTPDVSGYPTATDTRITCYVATKDGELSNLPVDGVALKWAPLFMNIPVPSPLDKSGSGYQWMRIALTKPLDRRLSNMATTAGLKRVVNLDGNDVFTSLDNGRMATLYDGDGNVVRGPEVITFINTAKVEFATVVADSLTNLSLYITEGGDHGLLMDMVHIGYISRAAYAPYAEDLNRTLPSTAAPNTSSQGGLGPGGDNGDPGDGGIGCVEVSTPVWVLFGNEYRALPWKKVPRGQLLKSGNHRPNFVTDLHPVETDDLHIVYTANGLELSCSPRTRLFEGPADTRGVPVSRLQVGDSVLTCFLGRDECSPIIELLATGQHAKVGTFSLTPGNKYLAGRRYLRWWQRLWRLMTRPKDSHLPSGIYCHNVKRDDFG